MERGGSACQFSARTSEHTDAHTKFAVLFVEVRGLVLFVAICMQDGEFVARCARGIGECNINCVEMSGLFACQGLVFSCSSLI